MLNALHDPGLDPLPRLLPTASKGRSLKAVLAMMAFALTGAALSFGAVKLGLFRGGGGASLPAGVKLAVMAGVILATIAALFTHEAGHALFGVAKGFRFHALAAGPLWIGRTRGRIRPSFNRIMATWGGIAVCVPVGDVPGVARRMAWMALGGPIMSLAFGLLALPAALAAEGVLRPVMMAFTLASFAIFAVTAFSPTAGGGMKSDGARARGLFRNDEKTVAEAALVTLTGLAMAGSDPRQWAAHLVERVRGGRFSGAYQVSADTMLASYELCHGRTTAARARLVDAIEQAAGLESMRPYVAGEAALFEILVRRDAAAAEQWLKLAEPSPFVERYRVALLRALLAHARADLAGVVTETEQATALLDAARFSVAALDRWVLTELIATSSGTPRALAAESPAVSV